MGFLYVDEGFVADTRQRVARGDGYWGRVAFELDARAALAMSRGPWSVTWSESPEPSAGPHDYYSQAPYWWPDPDDPTGPYIRHDGVRNPNRLIDHWNGFVDLSKTVIFLVLGGAYLDAPRLLERAVELLRVWFLDPETRMDPHLEYGEAIVGVCKGRAAGIIVLRQLDRIVHAATFLDGFAGWEPHKEAMKSWLADMAGWLTTSEIGIAESRAGNNHTSWWANHVATYAAYVANDELVDQAFRFFREDILPRQLDSDGSCPRELQRTRSMHYSLFNLDAMSSLCELAWHRGVDLWHFETPEGKSLGRAIAFMLPYLDNPYTWKWQQIDGTPPEDRLSLQLASIRLGEDEYARVNEKCLSNRYIVRAQDPLGPHVFFPGFACRDHTWEHLGLRPLSVTPLAAAASVHRGPFTAANGESLAPPIPPLPAAPG